MTAGYNPDATPGHEETPRRNQAASAAMREAWLQWAVVMLEEE